MNTIKLIMDYKINMDQKIAQRQFGPVYIGISDQSGKKVAVNILSKKQVNSNAYVKEAVFIEMNLLRRIKSQNIVIHYDLLESDNNYYVIQQLCDSDLSQLIKDGNKFNQNQAIEYLRQIVNGFKVLVEEGVIHRDLNPSNIMIKQKILKVGGFSFANQTQFLTKAKKPGSRMNFLYKSLQILRKEIHNSKCNIWSLGIIFYELLHGHTPWDGASRQDLINNIQKVPLKIDENLSKDTINFIKRCLQLTEQKRISWDQLFQHPIFNNYFVNQSNGYPVYENKFGIIRMNLHVKLNSKNININQVLNSYKLKHKKTQINIDQFYSILSSINSQITRIQSDYIFEKVDIQNKKHISIDEIQMI